MPPNPFESDTRLAAQQMITNMIEYDFPYLQVSLDVNSGNRISEVTAALRIEAMRQMGCDLQIQSLPHESPPGTRSVVLKVIPLTNTPS